MTTRNFKDAASGKPGRPAFRTFKEAFNHVGNELLSRIQMAARAMGNLIAEGVHANENDPELSKVIGTIAVMANFCDTMTRVPSMIAKLAAFGGPLHGVVDIEKMDASSFPDVLDMAIKNVKKQQKDGTLFETYGSFVKEQMHPDIVLNKAAFSEGVEMAVSQFEAVIIPGYKALCPKSDKVQAGMENIFYRLNLNN